MSKSESTLVEVDTTKVATPKRRPIDATAFFLAIVCCFVWGLQQVGIKGTADQMDPLMQVTVRTFLSLVFVSIYQFFFLKEKWNPLVTTFHGFLIGFFYAGEFYFVAEGLRLGPSSHIAVLLYTSPLFAAVGLAWKLPEERLNIVQWIGILTAFGGVAFSILYPALHETQSAFNMNWILGDICGILAGLSWGLTTIAIRTTPMSNAAPTQMLFWQLLGSFIFLAAATLITGQTHFEPQLWGWINLGFQSICVSFLSYLAWCWMLRNYLASRLGVLSFMTPFFGMVLSVVILGETLQFSFLFGALMVFIGLILVQGEVFLKWFTRKLKQR